MAAPAPPRSSQRQEVWHGSPSRRRRSSGRTLPLIDPSREFGDIYSRMGQLLNLAFWDVGIGLPVRPSYGEMTRWLSTVATPGAEAAAARAALASLSECTWP
jgi:hypothetical protein